MSWHEWMQSVNPPHTTPLGNEFVLHGTATYGDHHQKTIRRVCEVLGESLLPTLLQLRDQQGRTPLHVAVECASSSGISTFIEELTNHGHGCLGMNVGDFANRTPLHWAAALGKLEAVKALVQDRKTNLNQSFSMWGTGKGAGYHFQGEGVENMTALHLAAFHNHFKVVEVLLNEKNVQANAKCICKLIDGNGDVCDYQDWSPFQIAAAKGHVQTMRVFIKGINEGLHGMNITQSTTSKMELQGGSNCIPELHLAAITSNPLAVKALLTWEEIDPFCVDHNGNTALHYGASAYDLRDAYGACDFVSLSHFTSQPSGKAKTFGGIVGCMDLLMQSGLQMEGENDQCEPPQLGTSTPKEVHQWWYKKMIQQTQEIKSKLDDAARSITVTAALVATASFVGPLQPPLGISMSTGGSIAQLDRTGVWEFIVFNSLSFYLAIASIMLAIIPSLPVRHENLLLGVGTFQHRIEAALFLLFCAIVYIVCAFSVSNIAIVGWNVRWDSLSTASEFWGLQVILLVATGAVICLPAIFAFIGGLLQLTRRTREPWWRSVLVFIMMGVVLALPMLGLGIGSTFSPGWYGVSSLVIVLCFCALCALLRQLLQLIRRACKPWWKLVLISLTIGLTIALIVLIVSPLVGIRANPVFYVDKVFLTCLTYAMSPLSVSIMACWLMWRSQGPLRPKVLKFRRRFDYMWLALKDGYLVLNTPKPTTETQICHIEILDLQP